MRFVRRPDQDGLPDVQATRSFERLKKRVPIVTWNGVVNALLPHALLYNLTHRYPLWVEPCPMFPGCCNPWHQKTKAHIGLAHYEHARINPNAPLQNSNRTNRTKNTHNTDQPLTLQQARRLPIVQPKIKLKTTSPSPTSTPYGKRGRPSNAELAARNRVLPTLPVPPPPIPQADADLIGLIEYHLDQSRTRLQTTELLTQDGYTPDQINQALATLKLPTSWSTK